LEGTAVVSDLDIVMEAGGKNVALDYSFEITAGDDSLDIQLEKVTNNAKISAIQVIQMD